MFFNPILRHSLCYAPAYGLMKELAAHWDFDESTGIRYSHNSQSNFILTQSLGSITGKFGLAPKFPGTEFHCLSCPDNDIIGIGENRSFTIGFWMYQGSGSTVQNIFIKGIDTAVATDREYAITKQTNNWQLTISNGVVFNTLTIPVTQSVWIYHLFDYDHEIGSASYSINNGVYSVATASVGSFSNNVGALTISGRPVSGSSAFVFTGSFDNLDIWHRVLTPTEKAWLYNSGSGLPFSQYINGP
jgi:hypothetical protein